MFSIYIHIPFCIQKCLYCDFLSFPAKEEEMERYVQALCKQIQTEAGAYSDREADTVFLGGGTPSVLPAYLTEQILEQLHSHFHIKKEAEISMEMNPGTASLEKMQSYRSAGINRLSIGLQSAQDTELRTLGRIHTWQQFETCYAEARSAGFSNLNIDVMSALPGQSFPSYRDTLEKVCCLSPEHISAYSLIVEENTPFYERYKDGGGLPGEEEDRQMYRYTGELLKRHGYRRYEISNYAKAGYECKHNKAYWKRTDYLGLGLGAASMINNVRFTCPRDKKAYLEDSSQKEAKEALSREEQMEEFMFLGLRLMEGVSEAKFWEQFGCSMESIYGDCIKRAAEEGLLDKRGGRICLTDYGIDVSNQVFARFLLD